MLLFPVAALACWAAAPGAWAGSVCPEATASEPGPLANWNPLVPTAVVGERVLLGCPLATPSRPADLVVDVVYWCAVPDMIRGQTEFKFKVRIENRTRRSIGIGLEHWRLLLFSSKMERWSAPRIGGAVGKPIRVRFAGSTMWAGPANAEGAFDRSPETTTFATHWGVDGLAAGETYFDRRRYRGDITFYVPERSSTLDGVVGLAYVDGRRVIDVAAPHGWGKRLAASAF